MPHRFRKIRLVVTRITRARSVIGAFRLAGLAEPRSRTDLDWADLMKTLESVLPSSDEMTEAISELQQAEIELADRPETDLTRL